MQIYQITYPPSDQIYQPGVIAIGFFDGVHLGHQQVIKRACKMAKDKDLPCGVMTFAPHPKEALGLTTKIDQITPIESKLKQLKKLNIDFCYIVNFTDDFAAISPEEFIRNFLVKLNVKGVVIGFDFTFGYKGSGTADTIMEQGGEFFCVDIVEAYYDQDGKISSTRVRDSLLNGSISDVTRLLGRNYSFFGKVIHGDKRGRTIGFPTANLELIEDYLSIKKGVYVVKVHYKGESYAGVMNVGYKPTFTDKEQVPTYEVYIIDFNQYIYHQLIEVEIIEYIREEKKFNNIEELKKQIWKDVQYAKQIMLDLRI